MAKYRKRPVVIDAVQYDGDLIDSTGNSYVPDWVMQAQIEGTLYFADAGQLFVRTLEGAMHVSINDYIIKGVQGEIYPCKPDIFTATYEEVE